MHCKFRPRELWRVDLCGPLQSLTVSDSADVVHRGYDGLMATPRETEPLVPKSGSLIFILVQSGLVVMISRVFINLHLESKARGIVMIQTGLGRCTCIKLIVIYLRTSSTAQGGGGCFTYTTL
jgi:hypothetical protein